MRPKIHLTCFAILILCLNVKSQEVRLVTESSLHYDIFSITTNNDNFKQRLDGLDPSFSLNVAYISKKTLILQSGLNYSNFGHNIGIKDLYFPDTYGGQYICVMNGISIPLSVGYKFNILKNLDLSLISGIGFTYYFNAQTGVLRAHYWQPTDPTINKTFIFDFSNALKQNFNIYLTNRINLTYKTKRNLSFSLTGMYNSGLFHIWEETAHLEINDESEVYDASITSNGSQWIFGIGVGYVFNSFKN